MKTQFTWIPNYQELADKLANWENRQLELIHFLEKLRKKFKVITKLEDKNQDGETILYEEIDPFTFMGVFNRGIRESTRLDILSEMKIFFNLNSEIPSDFDGVPVLLNISSRFILDVRNRGSDDVEKLWRVFKLAVSDNPLENQEFLAALDEAFKLKGIFRNITIGLFWIRPNIFLSLDVNNCEYLHISLSKEKLTSKFYFDTIKSFSTINESFPEISYNAWLQSQNSESENSKSQEKQEIRDRFLSILESYTEIISTTPYARNDDLWSLFNGIQGELIKSIKVRENNNLSIEWSVGKGNWTKTPWISILDKSKTESTQEGTYIVFLFPEDMSGVYLCLGQGITRLIDDYGTEKSKEILNTKSDEIWEEFPALSKLGFFHEPRIDLRSQTWRAKNYEYGVIAYKFYKRENIPFDTQIVKDIEILLDVYKKIGFDNNDIEPHSYSIQDMIGSGVFLSEEELKFILEDIFEKRAVIIQGPPGVGKTYIARKLVYALLQEKDNSRIEFIQFHQSYSYDDFIRGYRPAINQDGYFKLQNGIFFDFCEKAINDPDREYVFIIDEINRGNLSQIFGEVLMLIERDKRGIEFSVPLVYRKEDEPRFFVPENLYLIGLMNLADRSLAMVDYALRRRFGFIDFVPQFENELYFNWLTERSMTPDLVNLIVEKLSSLNQIIREDSVLGENYQIGHSYFCPRGDDFSGLDRKWYQSIVRTEIIPLLKEYWFDNPLKVQEVGSNLMSQ